MDTGACEAVLYDLEDGELLGLQTLPDGQYEAALLPDGPWRCWMRKGDRPFGMMAV